MSSSRTFAQKTAVQLSAKQRRSSRIISLFFSIQFFSLLFMQVFAIQVGGASISVLTFVQYAGLVLILTSGKISISKLRLLLFFLFVAAALVGQLYSRYLSALSFLQVLALYAPFVINCSMPASQIREIVLKFQFGMLIIAALVIFQLLWLSIFKAPIGIREIVPPQFWMEGYNYDNVIRDGSQFFRPNGLTMLEPSYASLFLGAALVVELSSLRRHIHLIMYTAALLGTYSGSGILLVSVALPWVFLKTNAKWKARFVGLGILALVAAAMTGVIEEFMFRLAEFSSPTSSVGIRFVGPLNQIIYWLDQPNIMFFGDGAGSYPEEWGGGWPVIKIMGEFGMLSAGLFTAFFVVCLRGSVMPALTVGVAFVANFSGGYLNNPVVALLIFLLCTLPRQNAQRANLARRPRLLKYAPASVMQSE